MEKGPNNQHYPSPFSADQIAGVLFELNNLGIQFYDEDLDDLDRLPTERLVNYFINELRECGVANPEALLIKYGLLKP